mmetsp:Transcript_14713/g.26110  ORF Transcript_14713/g.26110 Transcript_14713/m.26110 type:complete len:772 (+) Transcript_14713:116-2431(+)
MTRLSASVVLALLLAAGAAASKSHEESLEAEWSKELQEPETKVVTYKNPVKRVVALLVKMKAELTAEAGKESEMYDKMVCWCETNDKEKTEAIKKAEVMDADLSSEIEARSAAFGELETEIERLKKEIASNTDALKEATALREKEEAEFKETEKDLTQNVINLKNAIEVLSKHNAASFAQMDSPVLSSLRSVLRDLAFKREMMLASMSEHHMRVKPVLLSMDTDTSRKSELSAEAQSLLSVLDTSSSATSPLSVEYAQTILARNARGSESGFLQLKERQPYSDSYESYSSRSGPIFGILKQMTEEFEENLDYEQKQEAENKMNFAKLSAAKTAQISQGKAKLDELEESHGANKKALGDAKENLQTTRDTRSADVEFLRNLKVTCQDLDRQFEDRTTTRSMEVSAVSDAIKILTEDDAAELMRKTVSLLQESSESSEYRSRRAKAVASLRKAAQEPDLEMDDLMAAWTGRQGEARASALPVSKAHRDLSTLSLSVSLDSFTQVKAMMDKMVSDLKAEQEEEVQFKAACIASFDATEKELYEKSEDKASLEAKIALLAKDIEKLEAEMAEAKDMISFSEIEIKKASEARENENAAFQISVADQRATQAVLKKALLRLKEFYKKEKGGAALAQQEPPVKFQAYANNKGASPVIGLIEQIIEDSKSVEAEGFKAEQEAQASYELLVKDTNDIIAKLTAGIQSHTKLKAENVESSELAKSDLGSTEGELGSLKEFEANKHVECDWTLKNFQIRQKSRLAEIEAIQSAKAILSGAKR